MSIFGRFSMLAARMVVGENTNNGKNNAVRKVLENNFEKQLTDILKAYGGFSG